MSDQDFYATQSGVTNPADQADRLDGVSRYLDSRQQAARRLVFHCRADGDFEENGIAPDGIAEIDTRYADRMFGRLFEFQDALLTEDQLELLNPVAEPMVPSGSSLADLQGLYDRGGFRLPAIVASCRVHPHFG